MKIIFLLIYSLAFVIHLVEIDIFIKIVIFSVFYKKKKQILQL